MQARYESTGQLLSRIGYVFAATALQSRMATSRWATGDCAKAGTLTSVTRAAAIITVFIDHLRVDWGLCRVGRAKKRPMPRDVGSLVRCASKLKDEPVSLNLALLINRFIFLSFARQRGQRCQSHGLRSDE